MLRYQSAGAIRKGVFLIALTKATLQGGLLTKTSTHTYGMSIAIKLCQKVLLAFGITFTYYFRVLSPLILQGFRQTRNNS